MLLAWLAISCLPAHGQPPDANSGRVELALDLQGFTTEVRDLAFSPDGSLLAAAGERVVRVWAMATGELIATLRGQQDLISPGQCYAVRFSPDGRELVVGCDAYGEAGAIRVYRTANLSEIHELVPGYSVPVRHLRFTRDGQYLAAAGENGRILIWNWPTRKVVGTVELAEAYEPRYSMFEFATADPVLLVGEKRAFSLISMTEARRLPAEQPPPAALAKWFEIYHQAEFPFGVTAQEHCLMLDHCVWLAAGHGVSEGKDHHWAAIWRNDDRAPTTVYEGHPYLVTAVAFSPEVGLAASADYVGEVHVWEAGSGRALHVFRALGQPVYRASIDIAARRIAYGSQPLTSGQWNRNSYGRLEQSFDFPSRRVLADVSGNYPLEVSKKDNLELKATQLQGQLQVSFLENGATRNRYAMAPGTGPTCYSFLQGAGLGIELPVVLGDDGGAVICYAPRTNAKRREFFGHGGFISSLSESADGRFLCTASLDRTVRIWSLEGDRPGSGPDVRQRANTPQEQPADVAEPLLNLLVVDEDTWVVWTPQGYYDASPLGARLVGWHVNRGPERCASFYPLHQFRNHLYRPDIIDHVLETGGVSEAIDLADAERPGPAPRVEFRKPEAIGKIEPPRVRIVYPPQGQHVDTDIINVLAEVTSSNDLPIREVTVLVNGRPGLGKGIEIVPEGTTDTRRASFSRAVTLVPGANQITVMAANDDSTSVPVNVDVVYDAPEDAPLIKPDLYLLAIGVAEYSDKSLNLRYADQDAKKFVAAWQGQRGQVYENIQTSLLLNEQASAANIRRAMGKLLESVTQRDLAVIFISGHGVRDSQQNYYLASHEINRSDLWGTGVHFSAIERLLRDLPCKVLLFVDTCHSGGITGAKAAAWDNPLYDLVSEECGAVVFSSSLPREVSFENPEWGHGAFTKALLECFATSDSDVDGDGYLSLAELEHQIYQRVKRLTQGQQHPVVERPPTIPNFSFFFVGAA